MTLGLSEDEANALLAAQFQGVAFPLSDEWWQLHTDEPGATGTDNVAVNDTRADASTAFGTAPTGGVITNDAAVGTTEWASVPADETYSHISRWDSSTGGTFKGSGLITSTPVLTGDPFEIPAGDVTAGYQIAS